MFVLLFLFVKSKTNTSHWFKCDQIGRKPRSVTSFKSLLKTHFYRLAFM